jgi:hypothetical protein
MNPFTALKNLSPFHFTFLFFSFHLSYQPFTLLYFAIHLYNSLHFTSLTFTFYFLSPSLPPLFYTFLTLVLKIWVLPWEVPITPSGSWFQSVMDIFTKEYFPMSFVFWLWFSNGDRSYLSSLAPVTYLLLPSTPSHRYTLCRAHTCVLSSCAAPEIPNLSPPNDEANSRFLQSCERA